MSNLYIAIGFLALGAWLTYVCREKSGLWLVVPLGYGAVFGLAAYIAGIEIIDLDPARLADPLGVTFAILMAVLVLSAVGRFVAALTSPAARKSVAAHEVVHALWFGAAISMGALVCLFHVNLPSLTIRASRRPRYLKYDLAEWLPALRTDTNRTEPPLRIVQVIHNVEPECDAVEVPVSWDLMCKNGLLVPDRRDKGKREATSPGGPATISLLINGHSAGEGPCWRAPNGNCQLRYHHHLLRPGTNEIKVQFRIFADMRRLVVTGPPTQVEFEARGWVPD